MLTDKETYSMFRRVWEDSLKGNRNKDNTLPTVIYEEDDTEKQVPICLLMYAPEKFCVNCCDEEQSDCLDCPYQPEWLTVTPEDKYEAALLSYRSFKELYKQEDTLNHLRLLKAAESNLNRIRDEIESDTDRDDIA